MWWVFIIDTICLIVIFCICNKLDKRYRPNGRSDLLLMPATVLCMLGLLLVGTTILTAIFEPSFKEKDFLDCIFLTTVLVGFSFISLIVFLVTPRGNRR